MHLEADIFLGALYNSKKMGTPKKGARYMGRRFSLALSASIWGHCSQILVFTSIWGTQKGV